jgi:PAS domain S-box-containing protein
VTASGHPVLGVRFPRATRQRWLHSDLVQWIERLPETTQAHRFSWRGVSFIPGPSLFTRSQGIKTDGTECERHAAPDRAGLGVGVAGTDRDGQADLRASGHGCWHSCIRGHVTISPAFRRAFDRLQGNPADRCILWLGLLLSLFVVYVYRSDYLLEHPDVELYFNRDFLRPLRGALFGVTCATAALLAIALVGRRSKSQRLWILHAATQIWWVWLSLSAYAFGPLTSPVLGVLALGGFVSILLFPPRVVIPAIISGMTIVVVTTVATHHDLLPYAPLFTGPLEVDGRLPPVYVVATAALGFTMMILSFAFAVYYVERGRERQLALLATSASLTAAHAQLEHRIAERTAELSRSNELLTEEAAERRRVESALRDSETQLREQFAEFEHLYRHAPIGLCLQDKELRYVRINERLAAINGRPAAAHIGRTMQEVVPDVDARVGPLMRKVLDTGEPALDIELHAATPAEPGTERHWLTSYYPVKSPDGSVQGISVVVQDISELKWAEQRARQHLESLAHVSRLSTMGQMATGIAHELNQPLAAIANYAYIGQQKVRGDGQASLEEIRALFDELSALALRAGAVMHHLRGFVNKAQPDRVVTSVNGLVRDALTLVAAELRDNGIEPVLGLDDQLPMVRADAIQIQQVVLNLVRNAVDAMAGSDPSLRTLAITSRDIEGEVEIAVRDTGKGVTQEEADRAFDAFYTTKDIGMGMGLGICRSIIEDHGGHLWLESNPDRGATFRFTLPRATEGDAA